jgi:hypothetical protein
MYKAYFTRRLLQALSLAKDAASAEERKIHLRASLHYRALLGLERLPERGTDNSHGVAEGRRRG